MVEHGPKTPNEPGQGRYKVGGGRQQREGEKGLWVIGHVLIKNNDFGKKPRREKIRE